MKKYRLANVLTIAGFDSSGGAGIQADIKTISALGCYATSVLTSLPIQNTTGILKIIPISAENLKDQLEFLFQDMLPDVIKIGMLPTCSHVKVVVEILKKHQNIPVIYDPVMVSSSKTILMQNDALQMVVDELFPLLELITPNLDEAAYLLEKEIFSLEDMQQAVLNFKSFSIKNVLLKGGHLQSEQLTSVFLDETKKSHLFSHSLIKSENTHGTGCTLSSAIASYLALGKTLYESVALAQDFVHKAIEAAVDLRQGKGKGSLNHFFNPTSAIKLER